MRNDRPSTTAIKISRGLYSLARIQPYSTLLPEGTEQASRAILQGAGLLKPWMERVYASRIYPRMLRLSERFSPGTTLHMVLRKRVIDDLVQEAIAAGAVQVLVVGAGLDTLCVRLGQRHPEILAVEVDHPATHAAKRRGIEASGLSRDSLRLIAADLSERDLASVLADVPGWDPRAPSIVIAEGLLMYLDASSVQRFLGAVVRSVGPGSWLLFTYLTADASGRVGADLEWIVRASLEAVGEGLRWGPRPGELADFLAAQGMTLEGPEALDLAARYLTPAGLEQLVLAKAERVAVARIPGTPPDP